MMVSNRNLLFQGSIFRFHVCFGGCSWCEWKGASEVKELARYWVLYLKSRSIREIWSEPTPGFNQHIKGVFLRRCMDHRQLGEPIFGSGCLLAGLQDLWPRWQWKHRQGGDVSTKWHGFFFLERLIEDLQAFPQIRMVEVLLALHVGQLRMDIFSWSCLIHGTSLNYQA